MGEGESFKPSPRPPLPGCDQTKPLPPWGAKRSLLPPQAAALPRVASPSPPQTGPATLPHAPPPGPRAGGGREPLPTENSHFFAARFRNTPTNYVTRDTAPGLNKRRSVCAAAAPGERTGAGRGAGRARGRACLLSAAGARAARAPGPRAPAPRPSPRGRPRLRAANLVSSPTGRRPRPRPERPLGSAAWGRSAPLQPPPRPASGPPPRPPPELWGKPRALRCKKSGDPTPNSGGRRTRSGRATPPVLGPGGRGRGPRVTAAPKTPLPRARAPRARGPSAHPGRGGGQTGGL